ncbi:MAG: penicillin-binding protein activator, partial [Myxococcales bacterium]
MLSRTRRSALGCLLVGWAAIAGCGGSGDAPPPSARPPVEATEVDLVEPLTCADLQA